MAFCVNCVQEKPTPWECNSPQLSKIINICEECFQVLSKRGDPTFTFEEVVSIEMLFAATANDAPNDMPKERSFPAVVPLNSVKESKRPLSVIVSRTATTDLKVDFGKLASKKNWNDPDNQ